MGGPCAPHHSHQEVPIDLIEETFDVEVEHPVMRPATLPDFDQGVVCGLPGPISIGIPVKHRLQDPPVPDGETVKHGSGLDGNQHLYGFGCDQRMAAS